MEIEHNSNNSRMITEVLLKINDTIDSVTQIEEILEIILGNISAIEVALYSKKSDTDYFQTVHNSKKSDQVSCFQNSILATEISKLFIYPGGVVFNTLHGLNIDLGLNPLYSNEMYAFYAIRQKNKIEHVLAIKTKKDLSLFRNELETLTSILANFFNRIQFQKNALDNEYYIKAIIKSFPDILLLVNTAGIIVNSNCETSGNALGEIISKASSIDKIFPEKITQKLIYAIERCVKEDEYLFEFDFPKSHEERIFEARLTKANENEVILILRNITERKNYITQLSNAKERAEMASIAKTEFLANISHEIRTPMNAILGFSEILLDAITEPELVQNIKTIINSGQSLMALINDILDLSKIESGKLDVNPEPMDLQGIVEDVKTIFDKKAQGKNVMIHAYVTEETPRTVMLDDKRMRQVLYNLMGNAVKFTNQGFVKLKISAVNTGKFGLTDLIIEVKDTGIGIAKENHILIFDAFHQKEGNLSRKYGGTGLGLAITKKLVEKMNGSIDLESKLDKGSKFTITLHDVEIIEQSLIQEKPKAELKNNGKIIFESATVMVVDDFPLNIMMITQMLKEVGLNFMQADSGERAIEILKHHKPDLIFMDIRMKGLSGIQATEIIRNTPFLQDIKVVAFTASAINDNIEEAFKAFDSVLFKPTKKKDVIDVLKKYLAYKIVYGDERDEVDVIILPTETKSKLSEIIETLEQDYMKEWEVIKDGLIMYDIDLFATRLSVFAQNYNIEHLIQYCRSLTKALQSFDVEKVEFILKEFVVIIEQLKKVK